MSKFLQICDLSHSEIVQMLMLAQELKYQPIQKHRLANKQLAMIFQKPSLRTRVSFEVGMRQLGGDALYISPAEIGLGNRESTSDVARALSRYVDGIMGRVFSHQMLVELAEAASVPVINGLSDQHHPCQALADALTILEYFPKQSRVRVAYVGDGNNVAGSLLEVCGALGWDFAIAAPTGYSLPSAQVQQARTRTQAAIFETTDPFEAVADADVVYTDVWTSMGQEDESAERAQIFPPYQINSRLLAAAKPSAIVMHCLPAHHDMEISHTVFEQHQKVIFDQAENRMHAQKAILLSLMA